MDKSSWDTPKKTCFVERVNFLISKIHISSPSSLFNDDAHLAYFNIETGGQRDFAIDEKTFLKLRKGTFVRGCR